jgi:hypothetical protein
MRVPTAQPRSASDLSVSISALAVKESKPEVGSSRNKIPMINYL